MLFNSYAFLVFLPVAFALYWVAPERFRWIVLLLVSYYFYMAASPRYVLLLLCTSLVVWAASLVLERADREDRAFRKGILILTLLLCFGLLIFFKYYNFAARSIVGLMGIFSMNIEPHLLNLMMPVGISFYTFQSTSYLIDVYTGKSKAQPSFARFALYVSFFPQIIAGPIGRTNELMPQLECRRKFDYDLAVSGLRMMLWGYFKKLVISDALGKYVDLIYGNTTYYFGMTFIMVSLMYTFQIYCDFSGYSDIAIGTARLFNIELMQNFKSPYFSTSVREFWSRWHISLSTWFRDYVYIPLGGSRKGKIRKNINLMVTMLVSGLWHGANWTFVLWGGLHGIYQVAEGILRDIIPKKTDGGKNRVSVILHGLLTFALVNLAWIFFRADSISDAFFIVTHLHNGVILHFLDAWKKMKVDLLITDMGLWKLLAAIVVLMIYDFFSLKHDIPKEMSKWKLPLRWLIYIGVTTLIIINKLHGGTTQQFIYFNF